MDDLQPCHAFLIPAQNHQTTNFSCTKQIKITTQLKQDKSHWK